MVSIGRFNSHDSNCHTSTLHAPLIFLFRYSRATVVDYCHYILANLLSTIGYWFYSNALFDGNTFTCGDFVNAQSHNRIRIYSSNFSSGRLLTNSEVSFNGSVCGRFYMQFVHMIMQMNVMKFIVKFILFFVLFRCESRTTFWSVYIESDVFISHHCALMKLLKFIEGTN